MAKMGCAKCGSTKKMALGGSAVKKAPVQLYGIPQENMGTSSQMGFGKNGGSVNMNKKTSVMKKVKKMQDGGMSSTKTNIFGKSKDISNSRAAGKAIRFAKKSGSTVKSTDGSYTVKPSANSNRSVTTTFKKAGGAVKKPLMKAQSGGRIVNSPDGKSQAIIPGDNNYISYSAVETKKRPTPYQDYMKRSGADASDTLVKSGSTLAGYSAKNPKNNKALIKAVKATDKVSPMKKGGSTKSFPDLNKDGKITKADILKGRGIIKKKGGVVKKK